MLFSTRPGEKFFPSTSTETEVIFGLIGIKNFVKVLQK